MKFQFTIGPDGAVAIVGVRSSELPVSAEDVQECIRAAISTWRFPAPGGNIVVAYPFVLVPRDRVQSGSKLVSGGQRSCVWFPLDDYPARTAIVEVQDRLGRPVEGVPVLLTLATFRGRQILEAITDAHGLAVFSDVPSASTAHAIVQGVRTEQTPLRRTSMGVIVKVELDPEE